MDAVACTCEPGYFWCVKICLCAELRFHFPIHVLMSTPYSGEGSDDVNGTICPEGSFCLGGQAGKEPCDALPGKFCPEVFLFVYSWTVHGRVAV